MTVSDRVSNCADCATYRYVYSILMILALGPNMDITGSPYRTAGSNLSLSLVQTASLLFLKTPTSTLYGSFSTYLSNDSIVWVFCSKKSQLKI